VQVNRPLAPSLSRRGITRSIFMHSGEPKAHDICAQDDGEWAQHDSVHAERSEASRNAALF